MSQPATDPAISVALTYRNLNTVDDQTLAQLSQLTLAEIAELKQVVARMVPAGNLPGFLLHGLAKLQGRTVPQDRVRREVGQLIRGLVDLGLYGTFVMGPAAVLKGYQTLLRLAGKDVAAAFPDGTWQFYTEFALREDQARHASEALGFHQAWPAGAADEATLLAAWLHACAWTLFAYDDLLTNEWTERVTLRLFQEAVEGAVMAGRLGRWPTAAESAAIRSQSDGLSWLEQERDHRLRQLGLAGLAAAWTRQRPYWRAPLAPAGRGDPHARGAPQEHENHSREARHSSPLPAGMTYDGEEGIADYLAYRRAQFQAFVAERLPRLSPAERAAFHHASVRRQTDDLPLYLAQMSLLYALTPDVHREERTPIPLWQAQLAVVAEGRYFLMPACACDAQGRPLVFPLAGPDASRSLGQPLAAQADCLLWQGQPAHVDRRGVVVCGAQIVGHLRPAAPGALRQQAQTILRLARDLPADAGAADLTLATAPRSAQTTLRDLLPPSTQAAIVRLRLAPIVINWHGPHADQPLAVLRRDRRGLGDHALTIIRTDRSMVFDLSHIFFDGAWGVALAQIMTHAATAACRALSAVAPASGPRPEPLTLAVSPAFESAAAAWPGPVEVSAETAAIRLTQINHMRRHLAQRGAALTVNDVLLLARCLFNPRYRPDDALRQEVAALVHVEDPLARQAAASVEALWAGLRAANPSVLIPMDASAIDPRERIFPTTFRNPFPQIDEEWTRAVAHLAACRDNPAWLEPFQAARKTFFNHLRYFGLATAALKQVTMQGDSWNTAAIRLLAYLPPGLQRTLDWIPQEFEVLNEILKGDEVFSNVGQMAPGSSISRFISARDDGRSKVLVWGILSDAEGRLVVTLRDCRPHVATLVSVGRESLARRIAQDFLNGYAALVNQLVTDLDDIASYRAPKKDGPR